MGPDTSQLAISVLGNVARARERMARHRSIELVDQPYNPSRRSYEPEDTCRPDSGRRSMTEKPRHRAVR